MGSEVTGGHDFQVAGARDFVGVAAVVTDERAESGRFAPEGLAVGLRRELRPMTPVDQTETPPGAASERVVR